MNKLLCILLMVMISCTFSEECYYTGIVNVHWHPIIAVKSKIEKGLYAAFYSQTKAPQFFYIKGDTIIEGIEIGKQRLITFASKPNVEFQFIDQLKTARFILKTTIEDTKRYVQDAPMMFSDHLYLQVNADEMTKVNLHPLPITQQINFEFSIVKNNVTSDISQINAELSGIPYSFTLNEMSPERNSAWLKLFTKKEREEFYTAKCHLLGTNPHIDGKADISKNLDVEIRMSDKTTIRQKVNLSPVLDGFSVGTLTCKVNIIIDAENLDVSILDWEIGTQGDIHILQ